MSLLSVPSEHWRPGWSKRQAEPDFLEEYWKLEERATPYSQAEEPPKWERIKRAIRQLWEAIRS